MKKVITVLCFSSFFLSSHAQSQEAEQLLLNWEKLTQFKKILQDMYAGYKILYKGYTDIREISQGSFDLHKNFLNDLLEVSPAVKNYRRIADIINYQFQIVKDCKSAFKQFKEVGSFSSEEINYLEKIYSNILVRSLKCLDDLALVITSGTLRMNDNERLQAIDKIYDTIADQFSFLKDFNNSTAALSLQRKNERAELDLSKKLNDIK